MSTVKEVLEWVSPLQESHKGAKPLFVVETRAETPEGRMSKAERETDFPYQIKSMAGLHTAEAVWMVAEGIQTKKYAVSTWWHEQVGHHGLALLCCDCRISETAYLMGLAIRLGDACLAPILDRYGLDLEADSGRVRAAGEWFANYAARVLTGNEGQAAAMLPDPMPPPWLSDSIWRDVMKAHQMVLEGVTGPPLRRCSVGGRSRFRG
jgi:hypothetical protein